MNEELDHTHPTPHPTPRHEEERDQSLQLYSCGLGLRGLTRTRVQDMKDGLV